MSETLRIPSQEPPREDAWLSGVLGYAVYAAQPGVEVTDRRGRALYYAKVPVDDTDGVRRLTREGFVVVDVNVTLARPGGSSHAPQSNVEILPARQEHHGTLIEIAGSCFCYSRFHLDPVIPDEDADEVKREWVRSYATGARGVELLAAVDDGRAVGFLAVLDAGEARVIDLLGVKAEAQGRGVGGALVAAFVHRHGPGAAELRVGTQIANVPSLRLYARHGFVVADSRYVLHLHVGLR